MDEKVPRRMMRFYRSAEQKKQQYNEESYSAPYREEANQNYSQQKSRQKEEENESPTGRNILSHIPTMDYEDVNLEMDQKNAEEFRKIQQKNLEEKLALNEIEKFKRENKRLPDEKESDRIAENLFTQLKNSNVNELYGKETGAEAPVASRSGRRGRRGEEEKSIPQEARQKAPVSKSEESGQAIGDIKDILGEGNKQSGSKKKNSEDEFSLDLGEGESIGEGEDISSIEDIKDDDAKDLELEDKEECPNCSKETDKVLYCPNCGAAFCEKCSKKQGDFYLCPKCGTKTSK